MNKDKLLEWAWTIIANSHQGDWDMATEEWADAAGKWRDEYHKERTPGVSES